MGLVYNARSRGWDKELMCPFGELFELWVIGEGAE